MVTGLDLFRDHFASCKDQYVLIGGVAAALVMEDAGLDFRATKDIDVVLVVEMLDAAFVERFWKFIEAGQYAIRQATDETPRRYRFAKPADADYPFMLELFSRQPDGVALGEDAGLTPLPVDESVSSLSAILMDDEAYDFVLAGRIEINELRLIDADRLIPLKAIAWLDLRARAAEGEKIDAKDIRKHFNDVFRFSQLLGGETAITLPSGMTVQFATFLAQARDETIEFKALKIPGSKAEILARLATAYNVTGGSM